MLRRRQPSSGAGLHWGLQQGETTIGFRVVPAGEGRVLGLGARGRREDRGGLLQSSREDACWAGLHRVEVEGRGWTVFMGIDETSCYRSRVGGGITGENLNSLAMETKSPWAVAHVTALPPISHVPLDMALEKWGSDTCSAASPGEA